MASADLDLPLDETPNGRFLLWTTAWLVYLAILAFTITAVADTQLDAHKLQPRIVTVALPPNPDPAVARQELIEVIELLRTLPGVAYATLIDDAEIGSLVQPWLGSESAPELAVGAFDPGLPLPRLIDLAYNPGAAVDLATLDRELLAIVPGATIGDAGVLQRNQERLASIFRRIGAVVGLLLVAGTVLLAGWITRVNVTQHLQAVDLLRMMGAPDRYIAQQFEHHALGRSLRGALIGFVLGLATITIVLYGPPLIDQAPLTEHRLAPAHWVLLGVVPLATALAAAITARLTALFMLARLV